MTAGFLKNYIAAQKQALQDIPLEKVEQLIGIIHTAWKEDRNIFVFGNGGSAANASHFVTDLGKSASDKMGKVFRCLSLNDNVAWMTAIANDYSYEEVYSRQLQNYARPGDLVFTLSVSGTSPNVVKAVRWARQNGLYTIALVGSKGKEIADEVDFSIVINSTHYAHVEDAQMGICHMVCYAFIEGHF
ncbi:MAG TPA: SIS domain-containing protein [Flavitalea sp.]|nr:SIS domain-containing protein [Flavitalea sp.]